MILTSFATRNFRNLAPARLDLHPTANVLLGPNGQGKTNCLEAIYFLATTKSFRTRRIASLFRFDESQLFVEGNVTNSGLQKCLSVGIEAASGSRRRELLVNATKVPLDEYVEQLPVIAYSAARLEIIRGTPEDRRRFMDRGIATLRHGYVRALGRYNRALEQRNALLRAIANRQAKPSSLEPWDLELADTGAEVARERAEFGRSLAVELAHAVEVLDYHVKDLDVRYESSGVFLDDRDSILESLAAARHRELAAGFTLSGPHRDELAFTVQGRGAAEVLSSGELKVSVLLLKLARVVLLHNRSREKPVFLFDDVDAELDLAVIERLMGYIGRQVQLVATSAKEKVLGHLSLGAHARFRIEAGRITESRVIGD